MKKRVLTAKEVEHLAPMEARYEVAVGVPGADAPGSLYVVIHPSGKRAWCVRYRVLGVPRKLTFDEGLTLAQARANALLALEQLAAGQDPAEVQKVGAQAEPTSTKAVVEEWLKREVSQTRTKAEVTRIMNKEVLTHWKFKAVRDITRPDVLRLLDAIVDRKAPVLANRVLSILKRFFGWTLERGYIEASPVAGITPPSKEKSRDRVLSEDELRAIWNAAPLLKYPFGDYFRLLILTGQRRNEVAQVKWEHLDLDGQLWTLPKEANKAGRIHDVYICKPALELLTNLPRFTGPYVFTTTSGKRPISGFSKAKLLIDKKITEQWKHTKSIIAELQGLELAQWGIHDIRRTMTTWMANNDVPPHVLAAILNHSPGSTLGITAVYARSKWAKEKREALEAWAEYVLSLEKKNSETTGKSNSRRPGEIGIPEKIGVA